MARRPRSRPSGSGSLWINSRGQWEVAIALHSGNRKRIRRKLRTKEQAEAVLAALIEQYKDQLGPLYQAQREIPVPIVPPPRARPGLRPRDRWLILERDKFRCVYCGATSDHAELVVDHVVPVAAGGTNDPSNLATACRVCNAGKAAMPLKVVG